VLGGQLVYFVNLVAAGLWLGLVMRLDRHMADKGGEKNCSAAFLAGLFSVVPAKLLYSYHPFAAALEDSRFLENMLVVGPVEEAAKFLVFAVLVSVMKSVKEPLDGMLQAACVGLGFATVENLKYAAYFGFENLLVRSVICSPGHMIYACLWGYVWGAYFHDKAAEKKAPSVLYLLAAFLPSAVIHGAYNSLLDVDAAGLEFWLAILFDLFILAGTLKIFGLFLQASPYRNFLYSESSEAGAALNRGLAMYPESLVLRRRLGLHCLASGRFPEAGEAFRACAKRSNRPAQYRALEGVALFGAGEEPDGLALIGESAPRLPGGQLARMRRELRRILGEDLLPSAAWRMLGKDEKKA